MGFDVIGDYCKLYKNCSVCGRLKYHSRFASNGRDKSRRKSHCHECKGTKKIQYSFDTKVLKKTRITVRLKVNSKTRLFNKISYEDAVIMVEERMAGIVNNTFIHQLYSKFTFKELVLERDGYRCKYCEGIGTTIDHVIPISQGGITTFSNCVCACEKCNSDKGNLSLEEFFNTRKT